MDTITASVTETPKVKRPRLYMVIYWQPPHGSFDKGYWYMDVPRESRQLCERFDVDGRPGECIVEIPGEV